MSELSPELIAELQQLTIYVLIVILLVWILFAYNVRKTLLLIKPENQVILPNQAWFLAVPLFNIFWNFEVSKRLAYSFNNEFFDRKVAVEDMPTLQIGNRYAWSFLIYNIPFFPDFIRLLAFILCITYFISYWYKIVQFKSLIEEHEAWKQKQQSDED
ncbi:hypothetical protein [Sphingobacterium corticibacter]|uniref:DUF4328 domain-containing protein n=1 Tax=Sphingobacterium corticibacter TaxID=2171749 RepID=A0A2T8HKD8_9SPHI|nr:hypothetical protein [Sphingobacterium corticibacter]PVH25850.1 hypothetical protein DC487_07930 [Sphingobacterium corticibacter]